LFVADALYYRGDAIGQIEQMKTRPALPAEGYDHDNCSLDVLLNRLSVRDGREVLSPQARTEGLPARHQVKQDAPGR